MKKSMILVLIAMFTNSLANASCLTDSQDKYNEIKSKVWLFKKSEGKTSLGAVAEALGATALGVTAGGVVGFILPYAASGVTYAALGGVGVFGATAIVAPATIGTSVIAALGTGSDPDLPEAIPVGAAADGLTWFVWHQGRAASYANTVRSLVGAAHSASSAMISATATYFVPITAVIGGTVGLTIGVHDAIKHAQMKHLKQTISLLEAVTKNADDKIVVQNAYSSLPKRIRTKISSADFVQAMNEINNSNICNQKTMFKHQLYKLLKNYSQQKTVFMKDSSNVNLEQAAETLKEGARAYQVSSGEFNENEIVGVQALY